MRLAFDASQSAVDVADAVLCHTALVCIMLVVEKLEFQVRESTVKRFLNIVNGFVDG
jgi:hypothetical protein